MADTGIGMTPEESGRVFGEFVRIQNEQDAATFWAAGLGLSIVKKLVRLYDGKVEIQSQPDVGTTLSIAPRPPRRSERRAKRVNRFQSPRRSRPRPPANLVQLLQGNRQRGHNHDHIAQGTQQNALPRA